MRNCITGFRWPAGVDLGPLGLLRRDQLVHAVERDAAVVADDAATPIGIRQPGDNAGFPAGPNLRRVKIEHRVVMRLAVFGEGLAHRRVDLAAAGFESVLDHAESTRGHDRAAERLIGLEANDDFVFTVQVTGAVRRERGRRLRVDVEHAFLDLLAQGGLEAFPEEKGSRGRLRQELRPARIRGDIGHDEIADVDLVFPQLAGEILPRACRVRQADTCLGRLLGLRRGLHAPTLIPRGRHGYGTLVL